MFPLLRLIRIILVSLRYGLDELVLSSLNHPLATCLLRVIRSAKRHVVHDAGAHAAVEGVRHAEQVHHGGELPGARAVAETVPLAAGGAEAHDLGEELGGVLIALLGEGDSVEAADGVGGRNRTGRRRVPARF